jgi:hypothetical protein
MRGRYGLFLLEHTYGVFGEGDRLGSRESSNKESEVTKAACSQHLILHTNTHGAVRVPFAP